jgi:hypothetical protein
MGEIEEQIGTIAAETGSNDTDLVIAALVVFILIQIIFKILGAIRRKQQNRKAVALMEAAKQQIIMELNQQIQTAEADITTTFQQELRASETWLLQEFKSVLQVLLKQTFEHIQEAKQAAESAVKQAAVLTQDLAALSKQIQTSEADITTTLNTEPVVSETQMLQKIKRDLQILLKHIRNRVKEAEQMAKSAVTQAAESLDDLWNNAASLIANNLAAGKYGRGPKVF